MLIEKERPAQTPPFTLINALKQTDKNRQRREIITGLTAENKYIASKFFYDRTGGRLFEEITRLPEYYLTRCERAILRQLAHSNGHTLKNRDIIELGSGDCSKISLLFRVLPTGWLKTIRYVPVDVNRACIEDSAATLLERFPGLTIRGMVADFTRPLPALHSTRQRVFCFFGSTIGNLDPPQAVRFLRNMTDLMRTGDRLLLGADVIKERHILEQAYNDRRGVTAAFNRNILNVVNHLLGTNFRTDDFEHVAVYNDTKSRIEMHLKALKNMEIIAENPGRTITLRQGEMIHTENSYKFSHGQMEALAADAGLGLHHRHIDEKGWFSVCELVKTE